MPRHDAPTHPRSGDAATSDAVPGTGGAYDPARRRQSERRGKQRGVYVYIPADELRAAGMDVDAPPPFYRTWGRPHGRNVGTVLVRLYRDR